MALGFARLSVRPKHPKGNPAAQAERGKSFATLARKALPETARPLPIELWLADEARVGQQGTLTRIWARKVTRPRAPRDCRCAWAWLFGAACPERGVGAGTQAMSAHLAEISAAVAPGAHAILVLVLVLDGAGGQASAALKGPENIPLLPPPPHSPELNPVENVWPHRRRNWLSLQVRDDHPALVGACRQT